MTQVSKIKGLKVNQILEEARKHINIDEYMPDLHDGKLPYRDYVINVGKELNNQMMIVNTLLPNELQKLVEKAEIKREDRFIKKREITMKVLPEFHKMFFESKEQSSNIPIKRPYIEQSVDSIIWLGIRTLEEKSEKKEQGDTECTRKIRKQSIRKMMLFWNSRKMSNTMSSLRLKTRKTSRFCRAFLNVALLMEKET